MSYSDVRSLILACLRLGHFLAIWRHDDPSKNLLATGEVQLPELIAFIESADEERYLAEDHEKHKQTVVHMLYDGRSPRIRYAKFYFGWKNDGPFLMVFSVHE